MSEQAFTPGPWEMDDSLGFDIEVYGPKDHLVAVVSAGFDADAVDKANAQLIAAAPDLYKALEALLEIVGPHGTGADKALAKARGES